MTGTSDWFQKLNQKEHGNVTLGDKTKKKVIGKGKVKISNNVSINDVLLVDGLKFNLLSISQLCDEGYKIKFNSDSCMVFNNSKELLFQAKREGNLYKLEGSDLNDSGITCLSTNLDDSILWHRRLGHASFDLLHKITSNEHIHGVPKINVQNEYFCDACSLGKQHKSSFKSVNMITTSKPLELLHLDLFGPIDVTSLGGANYTFVIVDDYSRYTWTLFLANKDDAFNMFVKLCNKIQNEKDYKIVAIRSDRGGEFRNAYFEEYCDNNGINHNFSSPRTPQQNGVVERKNRTIQEMARTMLNEHKLPTYFWAEAVNTACYVLNRVLLRPKIKETPYKLWK